MLGIVTGGVGAVVLNLLKGVGNYFAENQKMKQDRMDKQHELKILDRQAQIELNKSYAVAEAEKYYADANAYAAEIDAREKSFRASMKSDIWIVSLLSGLIRPVTTICYSVMFFYFIYICIEYSQVKDLPPQDLMSLSIIGAFIELNMMIISFWFLNREFSKLRR